uniref:Pyrrolo-quinoline quinone repeat domain-containing protein n=1 Tax=Nannospalax galili TaxID=1026970 RepID=A0A8C6W537_NANGA
LYSGKMKWEQLLGDRIESSACVSKCGNFIVVGCYNGVVYVLKSNTGEKYWMFTTEDAVKSSPTMDPTTGLLYIGSHDQHAYALDIYAKRCIWKLTCGGAVFSSPCLSLTPHHLYCATLGGLLMAVDPVWQFSAGGPIFSSPCISSSQEIFFGSHDCFIYCCSMKGQLQWKFETTSRVYATPFAFQHHSSNSETLLAAASTDGKLWILESQT